MNMNSLFIKTVRTNSQLINYQSVRWRKLRKPFWLGIAKTKRFIVPEPKEIRSPEDKEESELLKKHYDSQLKSILYFIRHDNPALQELGEINEERVNISEALRAEMEESFKMNEKWNMETKKLRESRIKKDVEKGMEEAIEKISIHEKAKEKHMEIIEKIVREEKLLSETYITPENLDDAIENCLNKIDCYDFAIDLEGNKYLGREVLPSKLSDDKSKISEQSSVPTALENSFKRT